MNSAPASWLWPIHVTGRGGQGARRAVDADWLDQLRIAEAFGVREDTVRLWRSDFAAGGVAALKASIAPGPDPVKSKPALRVVSPFRRTSGRQEELGGPRLRAEVEAREGVRISRSQLSKALRKKSSVGGGPETR